MSDKLPSIDDFTEEPSDLPSVEDLITEEKELPSIDEFVEKEEEIVEEEINEEVERIRAVKMKREKKRIDPTHIKDLEQRYVEAKNYKKHIEK